MSREYFHICKICGADFVSKSGHAYYCDACRPETLRIHNLENTAFLKYDIEHLPLLFYRIIGILFMNIDVDELNDLLNRFITILTKILIHYQKISDQTFRIDYEFKGQCVQMVILAIFSFHYNIIQKQRDAYHLAVSI